MENICIMRKMGECAGYNIGKCIGLENCKYGKSREEQRAIEAKVVQGIQERMPYLYRDVKSLVDPGKTLIWADDHNALRVELRRV